jgi:D-beta-D-heptose 7-phosphate kinase/D-beta-D-heptose 1-phosphate adenosyltransferase
MIQEIDLKDKAVELNEYIDRFPAANVFVIGDIILDEYIWGDVSRISPEAPVPVVEVRNETKRLGGAANVVHNIISLGGKSILCGVIGEDNTGSELIEMLKDLGLTTDGILADTDRHTSIKTRVVAQSQQVVRFDRETRRSLDPLKTGKLLEYLKKRIGNIDAVIVADYGKGVISPQLMKGLRDLLAGSRIILAVDPKTDHFEYYKGIDVITPNHHEAGAYCRFEIVDEETLIKAGRKMLDDLDCKSVLITQGKEGMTLFEKDQEPCHIPTIARKVFDVSGAGDTVISTLCLGLASGMDRKSAAVISNFASGIVVGEVGTSVVTAEELKNVINRRWLRYHPLNGD